MSKVIDSFSGDYRFLSNFYPSPIKWKGYVWPTVEHAYQAAKSTNPTTIEYIYQSRTPGMAKRRGKSLQFIREDWDKVKLEIMATLVTLKFKQNKDLRLMLEATGDAELIEGNTWGDKYWGVCDGEGENMLGKILMEVRNG